MTGAGSTVDDEAVDWGAFTKIGVGLLEVSALFFFAGEADRPSGMSYFGPR